MVILEKLSHMKVNKKLSFQLYILNIFWFINILHLWLFFSNNFQELDGWIDNTHKLKILSQDFALY